MGKNRESTEESEKAQMESSPAESGPVFGYIPQCQRKGLLLGWKREEGYFRESSQTTVSRVKPR